MISGVIATSGTDRSNMAIGMNVWATGRNITNSAAATTAAPMPHTNPIPASFSVIHKLSRIALRSAEAVGSVNR